MMHRALFSIFAIFSATCLAEEMMPSVADFYGRWTVTDVVGYADMGGGIPHAKYLLGKVMVITADGINFDHDACKAHNSFRVRMLDTASDLRENAGASPEDAELPPKVALLDSEHCPQIYWLNPKKIEFDDMGVFVRAVRDTKPRPAVRR